MRQLGLLLAASLVVAQPTVQQYCDALYSNCYAIHSLNSSICQIAMANIMPGNDGDMNVNTLACRWQYFNTSNLDPSNTVNNTEAMCRYAGPTGGGRCGDVLSNVCNISTTACAGIAGAAYPDWPSCMAGLANIPANWGSLQGPASGSENSLECRVYHAMFSLSGGNETGFHCAHFAASPTPCGGPISTDVQHYCETTNYFCDTTGANAQFNDMASCMGVGMGYPTPAGSDASAATASENSLGCRQYHAQNAAINGLTHCSHAGPAGHPVCGDISAAWGSIQAAAPCMEGTANTLMSSVGNATIVNSIVGQGVSPTIAYYTSLDQTGNTQACRVYHLSVAASSAANAVIHCVHGTVSGGNVCGSYASNLCNYIQAVCGFGTATYQFPDSATCNAKLGVYNTTNYGDERNTTGDSLGCRFYHVGVAATFMPGAASGMLTGAMTSMQTHCGHVLAPFSVGGGCNPGMASPTNAPAGGGSSDASFLGISTSVFVTIVAAILY